MSVLPRVLLLFACLLASQANAWPTSQLSAIRPIPLMELLEDPARRAARQLTAAEASLSAPVAERAMQAVFCAQDRGMPVETLLVVDMATPAQQRRLWAFDLRAPGAPRLVLHEYVAHGSGSDPDGDGRPQKFSNRPNSHMTSLGLYRVAERYHGKNGWSRRLDGLTQRFNDKARQRAVVMHPSNYVVPGRVGRSQGCPAVSEETMRALEEAGLENAVLWIDAPDSALAKTVAECSEQRRLALIAQAFVAWNATPAPTAPLVVVEPQPATELLTDWATPDWPQWPVSHACRLTTAGGRRWQACLCPSARLDGHRTGASLLV